MHLIEGQALTCIDGIQIPNMVATLVDRLKPRAVRQHLEVKGQSRNIGP